MNHNERQEILVSHDLPKTFGTKSMIGREGTLFYHRDRVETGAVVLRVRNLSRRGLF
jgi:hypothetical protein